MALEVSPAIRNGSGSVRPVSFCLPMSYSVHSNPSAEPLYCGTSTLRSQGGWLKVLAHARVKGPAHGSRPGVCPLPEAEPASAHE
eukprot:scaffold114196_cov63-Phaeocystis_antarctica.AAC.2